MTRAGKALIATALPFQSAIRVDTHHFASFLTEKGFRIGWIPYPLSPFHLLTLRQEDTRLRFSSVFHTRKINCVVERTPFTLLPPANLPLLRSRLAYMSWHRLGILHLPLKPPYAFAYTDSAIHAAWLVPLAEKYAFPLIYRIADEDEGFSTTSMAVRIPHQRLVQHAALLLCANHTCMEKHTAFKEKLVYWPNGILLSRMKTLSTTPPEEYKRIPKPRVLYIGMISEWFDTRILPLLLERIPHAHVILIGPIKTRLPRHERLHILGPRPYDALGGYIAHADVGIIPFNPHACCPRLIHNIHPIKLYEYAFFGLPIVAFKTHELEALNPPIRLASTRDDFVRAVKEILEHPPSATERARLVSFATSSAYETRFEKLITRILPRRSP